MFLSRLGQDLGSVFWEDILRHFDIPFKRRSSGVLVILCQVHSEKTPSLHCWPDRKRFWCFGCGWGGDMFEFVYRKMFDTRCHPKARDANTLQELESVELFFERIARKQTPAR